MIVAIKPFDTYRLCMSPRCPWFSLPERVRYLSGSIQAQMSAKCCGINSPYLWDFKMWGAKKFQQNTHFIENTLKKSYSGKLVHKRTLKGRGKLFRLEMKKASKEAFFQLYIQVET
jgi:hypothetical protein